MRLASIAVVVSTAALMGCQPSTRLTPQQENVQRQILGDRMNEWVQSVNNNQIDAAIAMYIADESLTLVQTDGSRGSGAEAAGSLRDFMANLSFINVVPQNPNFDLLDANTAVVAFRFSVDAILLDTTRDPFAGQGTMVWVMDPTDNLWKIHTQHLSRNPM